MTSSKRRSLFFAASLALSGCASAPAHATPPTKAGVAEEAKAPELASLLPRLEAAAKRVAERKKSYVEPKSGEPTDTPYTAEGSLADEANVALAREAQALAKSASVTRERMNTYLNATALAVLIDPSNAAAEEAIPVRAKHKKLFHEGIETLEKTRREELGRAINNFAREAIGGNGG